MATDFHLCCHYGTSSCYVAAVHICARCPCWSDSETFRKSTAYTTPLSKLPCCLTRSISIGAATLFAEWNRNRSWALPGKDAHTTKLPRTNNNIKPKGFQFDPFSEISFFAHKSFPRPRLQMGYLRSANSQTVEAQVPQGKLRIQSSRQTRQLLN